MRSESLCFVFLCLLQQYVICTISTLCKQAFDRIIAIPAESNHSAQKRLRRRMKLCFSGTLVELPSIHTDATVLEAVQHIASYLQKDVISLNVIYHGQVLDHSKRLSDYGIQRFWRCNR